MVHPCDKPCGNKTASGYCATTACINPQYSNIGTVQYGQGVQKRIITNADRIRSMTDEELAEFLNHSACPPGEDVTECCSDEDGGAVPEMCNLCWLDWLWGEGE